MNTHSHCLDDYDYHLPPECIAQRPAPDRASSRLMVLVPQAAAPVHRTFVALLDYLRPGDLLVRNTTRVFPARLLGRKQTGGRVELFLLAFPQLLTEPAGAKGWQTASATALIKSSKRPKPGSLLDFTPELQARVETLSDNGEAQVTLLFRPQPGQHLEELLNIHGQVPLPPYIGRSQGSTDEDRERYQTRYAQHVGSVAAPTAGLHFSDQVLAALRDRGVEVADIVLHVGYGTFAPVRTLDIRDHAIHHEAYDIPVATAQAITRAKAGGGRIWAVGTTTVRTLEYAADGQGSVHPGPGTCDLFIYPGFRFQVIDNLITNFHLPKSSLLFLVSALAGRERILAAYQEAVAQGYRFFSYGDAMAIVAAP